MSCSRWAEPTIAPRTLPSYLRHDRRFFRYRPPTRIVRLVELYHP